MRMVRLGLVLALCLTVMWSARARERPPSGEAAAATVAPAGGVASVAAGNEEFALRLYQQLRSREGNLFFSPYSLSLALAMTYAGAREETARQMAQALSFYLPQDQLPTAFHTLSEELARRGEGAQGRFGGPFRLHLANALWGQRGHPFLPSFLHLVNDNYGGGLRPVDFVEPARAAINRWVSDETQGKITDLIGPGVLTPDTRLVLTNAIFFDAAWAQPFEPRATAPGPFTLLSGRQVTVPLMHEMLPSGSYAQGNDWQAVSLPYSGRELEMVVLLPAPGSFHACERSLHAARLDAILAALRPGRVQLTLPKFHHTSDLSLKPALEALGMYEAFGNADFSGMDGQRDLSLSVVLHKALVDVDEAGTLAAAATAVGMPAGAGARPPEIRVVRPFLFLIRDVPTGTVLFVGRIVDPR